QIKVLTFCAVSRLSSRALVDRRTMGEWLDRNTYHFLSLPARAEQPVVRHLPDDLGLQVPAGKDRPDLVLTPGPGHDQHPLLRLGEQKLVGGDSFLTCGHDVEVHEHASAAASSYLYRRAGESSSSHVLNADA